MVSKRQNAVFVQHFIHVLWAIHSALFNCRQIRSMTLTNSCDETGRLATPICLLYWVAKIQTGKVCICSVFLSDLVRCCSTLVQGGQLPQTSALPPQYFRHSSYASAYRWKRERFVALKVYQNAFPVRAVPQTRLGELTTLPHST